MSSVLSPARPAVAVRPTVWPLVRIEAKRYARHPLFLTGVALAIVTSAGERGPIELDYQVIPSFFIGVFGLIVAMRLTTATRRAQPVVDAAPVTQAMRTAALCLACLVPAGTGVLLVLFHRAFVLADPFDTWMYGTYGPTERFVITMVIPVIACAGGPLLGICVARWARFPGLTLVAVMALLLWSELASYLPAQGMDGRSLLARVLHMTSPYTAFGTGNGDGRIPTSIRSYTGSPLWFAVWALALCGLASAAAMWRSADGRTRTRAGRSLAGLAVLALFALTLSISTGNQLVYDTSPTGTVPADLSAPAGG